MVIFGRAFWRRCWLSSKAELFDLLVHLPAVDSPEERKALILFTGYADLGIYLDWRGSNVEFFTRLLDEFGRRGKEVLLGFLAALPNAPQVSVDREEKLAELRTQVAALDEGAWGRMFGGTAADVDMLAAAVVGEILAPYYVRGADGLRDQAGGQAVQLAENAEGILRESFAGDASGLTILDLLKSAPGAGQAALMTLLKAKLNQDSTLAQKLSDLLEQAKQEPEQSGLNALVEIAQTIDVVRGEVVGVVIGSSVVGNITAKVTQNVKEVDGKLTGAVIGQL